MTYEQAQTALSRLTKKELADWVLHGATDNYRASVAVEKYKAWQLCKARMAAMQK